jgi:hypothetical protein
MFLPSSVEPTLLKFSRAFDPRTAARLSVLIVGLILCRGRHTVAEDAVTGREVPVGQRAHGRRSTAKAVTAMLCAPRTAIRPTSGGTNG